MVPDVVDMDVNHATHAVQVAHLEPASCGTAFLLSTVSEQIGNERSDLESLTLSGQLQIKRPIPLKRWTGIAPEEEELVADSTDQFEIARAAEIALDHCDSIYLSEPGFERCGSTPPGQIGVIVVSREMKHPPICARGDHFEIAPLSEAALNEYGIAFNRGEGHFRHSHAPAEVQLRLAL